MTRVCLGLASAPILVLSKTRNIWRVGSELSKKKTLTAAAKSIMVVTLNVPTQNMIRIRLMSLYKSSRCDFSFHDEPFYDIFSPKT